MIEKENQEMKLEEAMRRLDEVVSLLDRENADLEDAMCEMDAANEERLAAIEDALCEIDMG